MYSKIFTNLYRNFPSEGAIAAYKCLFMYNYSVVNVQPVRQADFLFGAVLTGLRGRATA